MDATEQFLQALTEAHGVSGYETEVRTLLQSYLEPLGEVSTDKLGSLICRQSGTGPKVMLVAHMDEIGFLVKFITKDGFIKFLPLGGWWDQTMLGHRVIIKTENNGDLTGVIGAKPPHLLMAEERNKIVTKDEMYIDIGAVSREEVENAGIQLGDPIIPQSNFEILANGKTYLSKAFDDRIGCAVAIETLRHFNKKSNTPPNQLYGVMTVMEEVGVRGATTSVAAVNPDVAIILESDIAGDVPGVEDHTSNIKLGKGPGLSIFDARMIPNVKLRRLIVNTAKEENIPLQISNMPRGGTDGGAVHLHGTGVPAIVLGVPSRHIHSHGAIIHRDDYENAIKLVTAVVAKLNKETVAGLTA